MSGSGYILPIALLLVVVFMLRSLRRTDQYQRSGYTAATCVAALAAVLLIRVESGFPLSSILIGYLIATGLGVTQPLAPVTYDRRRSSSLEMERAWKRFDNVMLQNRWLNLTIGLLLIIGSFWYTYMR